MGTVTMGTVTMGTVTMGTVTMGTVTMGTVTMGTVTMGTVKEPFPRFGISIHLTPPPCQLFVLSFSTDARTRQREGRACRDRGGADHGRVALVATVWARRAMYPRRPRRVALWGGRLTTRAQGGGTRADATRRGRRGYIARRRNTGGSYSRATARATGTGRSDSPGSA